MTMDTIYAYLVMGFIAAAPNIASADHLSMLATGGYMMPKDGIAEAAGGGAELRVVDNTVTIGMSATALIGRTPAERRRDLMDMRLDAMLKVCGRCDDIAPYVGVGFDILHVTTHEGGRALRGSTLGLSGHAGFIGEFSNEKWMWRAGVSYLGAIVPGTGEDLGGVTFSVGLGKRIID